ncbi:MAG: 1-(5-phosphoribosyl)-5-[(5-phosphoribosylamino)methylideneamino]imidazole-4-carboxamide isomerase [Chloroflexi bacterium]|nr:1-(5-phosphoribosyl)-5-[(5-phosphoribosylamino)methylideneamino]imidazole-4-carboxamide isomerase [Chloroflexota bacterium]MQC17170.1 1-(5-phosphoribosyl)-5-[(5-phosphoribosylamino)methylideneamino]imidazole-4-carboxamide isomerase [Chloroflexota bacterium]
MEIIPAIDILNGKCVRLAQGDYSRETVFGDDPVAMALRWVSQGAKRIHVVDLDGARSGLPTNAEIVSDIADSTNAAVQTGGGIRNMEAVNRLLDAGVDRVVIGTAAVKDPQFLREAVATAGEHLIVSVDAREGRVSLEGWTEATNISAIQLIERLSSSGVGRIVYTDILRDGVTDGPNFEMYERLTSATSVKVIAAGGVGSVDDIRRLSECGVEAAIVGRALYTGDIKLSEAFHAALV